MTVVDFPQASIYETTIENAELEEALEEREKAKTRATAERKKFRERDEAAKALVATLDLADAPVRVGRFLLTQSEVAGRSVAFETEPSTRLRIRLLEDAA